MIKDLDFSKLENPYVQVVWEDTPENFTQEKLKSVKAYFQKKYSTTSVNVITKLKKTEEVKTEGKATQRSLITQCFHSIGYEYDDH